MTNIYLAGPYSADNLLGAMKHIRTGQYAATVLMKHGLNVHCPWLDYQLLLHGEITVADFQRNSLSFLTEWAHLMILLPGWWQSKGSRAELEVAFDIGVPSYDADADFIYETYGLCPRWWEPV